MRQVVVMVLPYGEPDRETRTALEYAGYLLYLRGCARVIADLGRNVETVLIPSIESKAVSLVLQQMLEELNCLPTFFYECESTTTPGGIALGWEAFQNDAVIPTQDLDLLILCDQARKLKVMVLAWWLLQRKGTEVLGISRPDINWKSNQAFQVLETLALVFFPPLLRRRLR